MSKQNPFVPVTVYDVLMGKKLKKMVLRCADGDRELLSVKTTDGDDWYATVEYHEYDKEGNKQVVSSIAGLATWLNWDEYDKHCKASKNPYWQSDDGNVYPCSG